MNMHTTEMVGFSNQHQQIDPHGPFDLSQLSWRPAEILEDVGRPHKVYLEKQQFFVRAKVTYEIVPVQDTVLIS